MSENDEDFMSDNEKIIFGAVLCGICNIALCYIGILLLCCKKKPIVVSNTTILIEDVENQRVNEEISQEPKQVNHINFLDVSDKNIDCSVCLDTDESEVIGLSLCGHKFHKNCIYNLNTCPMCRAIISRLPYRKFPCNSS
jgi:hypothetical protein